MFYIAEDIYGLDRDAAAVAVVVSLFIHSRTRRLQQSQTIREIQCCLGTSKISSTLKHGYFDKYCNTYAIV